MVDTVEGGTGVTAKSTNGRYTVSRKGMGGRKPKYTEEFLNGLVEKKRSEGVSIKEQCRVLGLPYISVYMAMKRLNIDNPRKVTTTHAPVVVVADGDRTL